MCKKNDTSITLKASSKWSAYRKVVHSHGRNEVRLRPGQETSLAPPCSNLRSFASKCAVEESTCDIVVTFRHPPQSFSAPIVIRRPENCATLPTLVTPLCAAPLTQACYFLLRCFSQLNKKWQTSNFVSQKSAGTWKKNYFQQQPQTWSSSAAIKFIDMYLKRCPRDRNCTLARIVSRGHVLYVQSLLCCCRSSCTANHVQFKSADLVWLN